MAAPTTVEMTAVPHNKPDGTMPTDMDIKVETDKNGNEVQYVDVIARNVRVPIDNGAVKDGMMAEEEASTLEAPGQTDITGKEVAMEGDHEADVKDGQGFDKMGSMIKIKQVLTKGQLLEMFLGCDAKNYYEVTNEQGEMIFFITEESQCWCRYLLKSSREMKFRLRENGKDGPIIATYDKPWDAKGCFPLCFFKRPHFDVYDGDMGDKLGEVHDPFACCNLTQIMKNDAGDLVYKANGCCCQMGLCGLGACCAVIFNITDDAGQPAGKVVKDAGGLMEWICGMNKFHLEFPEGTSMGKKKLLIGSAMLFDVAYMELQEN